MRPPILAILVLTGCAAAMLGETECREINWYARGEQDALMGNRPMIDQYKEQCSRFGAAPSEPDYLAGWNAGYAEWNRRVAGRR